MTRLLALCLATVAFVAAGCGGDDKGDYTDDVQEIGQKLQESSVGADLPNVNSPQQLADALRRVLGSLNQLVTSGGAKKLSQGLSELEDKGYDVQADASGE